MSWRLFGQSEAWNCSAANLARTGRISECGTESQSPSPPVDSVSRKKLLVGGSSDATPFNRTQTPDALRLSRPREDAPGTGFERARCGTAAAQRHVRKELCAGGRWIRTLGPPGDRHDSGGQVPALIAVFELAARRCVAARHQGGLAAPSSRISVTDS